MNSIRLASPWAAVLAVVALPGGTTAAMEIATASRNPETYSTNAICRKNHCINPVFPALQDLSLLEEKSWQCVSHGNMSQFLKFCEGPVNYNVALTSLSNVTSKTIKAAVTAQEKSAVTAYFYHLSAMKMEPWEHRNPKSSSDSCVQSVWKMACLTHFPRAASGCGHGADTDYARPCKQVCDNYVSSCDVKCCDESTRCVFDTEVDLVSGKTVTQRGYVDPLQKSCTF